MATGKVKWYNETKGYGFIVTETGEEIFLHRTSLPRNVSVVDTDQAVEFDTEKGQKGMVAKNVKLV